MISSIRDTICTKRILSKLDTLGQSLRETFRYNTMIPFQFTFFLNSSETGSDLDIHDDEIAPLQFPLVINRHVKLAWKLGNANPGKNLRFLPAVTLFTHFLAKSNFLTVQHMVWIYFSRGILYQVRSDFVTLCLRIKLISSNFSQKGG